MTTNRSRAIRCRSCLAIPRPAAWSACCAHCQAELTRSRGELAQVLAAIPSRWCARVKRHRSGVVEVAQPEAPAAALGVFMEALRAAGEAAAREK